MKFADCDRRSQKRHTQAGALRAHAGALRAHAESQKTPNANVRQSATSTEYELADSLMLSYESMRVTLVPD
jgi:hypothetical protein